MKTLKKFLNGLKGEVDPEEIENYYGHGANEHVSYRHSQKYDHLHHSANKYKCPMGCEGDKTYDIPGNCPVCHMKLILVGDDQTHNG